MSVKEVITDNGISSKKYELADFSKVADYICDTWSTRKKSKIRRNEEKKWKEIDRQIEMEPDISFKTIKGGRIDDKKAWMPEIELPSQAQTLEVLCSDARRFMFPGDKPWYTVSAEVSDELLEKVAKLPLIAGDSRSITSQINHDNIEKIITGTVDFYQDQYDFQSNIDLVNGEAFKYGVGVARTRPAKKRILTKTARGNVAKDKIIPITYPSSIKNTYLDDSKYIMANEGFLIGDATISEKPMSIYDIKLAAHKGEKGNIDSLDGGWMPDQLEGVVGDDGNNVQVLEYEGDLIVEVSDGVVEYFQGAIVLVVIGKSGKTKESKTLHRVVRFRRRKSRLSSYTEFHYHKEHVGRAYSASPLKKGYPLQKCATEALSRLMQSAILNTEPPAFYDRNDPTLAANGLEMFPGSQTGVHDIDSVKFEEIGNPTALLSVFTTLINLYSDVTGVNRTRLGEQSKSHTTAFAKNADMQQGVVRTVDYTDTQLLESMTKVLDTQYEIARENIKEEAVYVDAYQAFVTVSSGILPENVKFIASGSNAPNEEKQTIQERTGALMAAVNLDNVKVQMGGKPMKIEKIQKQLLQQAGLINADEFFENQPESQVGGTETGSGVSTIANAVGGSPAASLQNIEKLING